MPDHTMSIKRADLSQNAAGSVTAIDRNQALR
jgi:hypothetical protein